MTPAHSRVSRVPARNNSRCVIPPGHGDPLGPPFPAPVFASRPSSRRALTWTGDIVTAIVDNLNPGTVPPSPLYTYAAQTQSFAYTPTRRLSSAAGYYGALGWTYDANGNRISETANGVLSSYAYPAGSSRLSSVTPAGGSARSFTYDAAGNILTDSRTGTLAQTFQYDPEGRLSRATSASSSGTYAYDAQDRLASRVALNGGTTTTTLYVHDVNDHIIAETDTSGVTRREYLWLNDLAIAVVDNVNTASPTLYYVHTDHLGRPVRMLAQNWAWAWDVVYMPFGAVSSIWDGTSKLDMRFPGQWFQLESGLAYNWHRHYDATIGRYVQPDPIGLNGGRSLYGYVGQSPFAYVDRDGHNAGTIAGAEIGTIVWPGPGTAIGAVMGTGAVAAGAWAINWCASRWNKPEGFRECTSAEYAACEEQCGPRGVESCSVGYRSRVTGTAGDGRLKIYTRKDAPVSCSCNE